MTVKPGKAQGARRKMDEVVINSIFREHAKKKSIIRF
jgi:hypothetical protein